jgi:hypothetical protein
MNDKRKMQLGLVAVAIVGAFWLYSHAKEPLPFFTAPATYASRTSVYEADYMRRCVSEWRQSLVGLGAEPTWSELERFCSTGRSGRGR